jgi:hypothetical protein
MPDHEPSADPADATCGFHERIQHAAVTIRRQQLQRLQSEGTSDNKCDDQNNAVGVSQTERQPHECKCREVLELGAGNDRTVVNRRQRRIHDKGEREPSGSDGYPLDHQHQISYNSVDLNILPRRIQGSPDQCLNIVNPTYPG